MSGKMLKLYVGKPSYKHILLRYAETRPWRYAANWKLNYNKGHYNVITPFLRLTKCNGQFCIGLGNHYLEFGW